jgi:protein ImuB
MSRVACACIPHFEIAVFAPDAAPDAPVAIADLAMKTAPLRGVNAVAERHGVRVGMVASRALALCPELRLVAPDSSLLQEAELRILKALSTLSPLLDADGLGAFFLEASRLEHIHPDERALADRIRETLRGLGFEARVAVADRPLAAWVAARRTADRTIVPAGADVAALAGVPLAELGLVEPVRERLELLGIETVGQLLGLPAGTLSSRMPVEGPRLERICRGEERIAWPGRVQPPSDAPAVEVELDAPTSDLEPLLFTIKSLLDRLLASIAPLRRSLAELTIAVRLDDRTDAQHRLVPAHPTLESRIIMDLVRLWLGAAPFPTDVRALKLIASRLDVATARQLGLFEQRLEQTSAALQQAVMRLKVTFGESAVVKPVLRDTYRPEERLQWEPFTGLELPEVRQEEVPGPTSAPVALRMLPAPEAVQWAGRKLTRADRSTIRVVAVDGPHHLSGDWWHTPFDRNYYWISGEHGERLWVFHNVHERTWWLQAWAD